MKIIFTIELNTREKYGEETLRQVATSLEGDAWRALTDAGGNVEVIGTSITTDDLDTCFRCPKPRAYGHIACEEHKVLG